MAEGDPLPDQVRRMAARAEELQRELAGEQPGTEGDQPSTAEVPPQGDDTTGSGHGVEPPSDQPPVGEPSAAPPVHGDWEQRYRTLQGKYDSEIPALRQQVQGLERLLATMQREPAAPEPPKGPLHFEEGDVDIYGQDFLEAAARAASARYEPVVARLEAKIKQLEGGQTNLNAASHENRMFAQLDKDPELAGWREVNTDPNFIAWLKEPDEFAGVPRNQILQHAYANNDAMRVGRWFKKYLSEHTAPLPNVRSAQTDLLPRPNGNGQMVAAGGTRLEDMVVPGRASRAGGSGDGAQNPRIWSRAEITRFYRDRTSGKYRGREDEAARLEADLFNADREGRIH